MEEPLSQTDIVLRDAIICVIKAELTQPGELTYAMNKMFDKRYDHRRDLDRQLEKAEARVHLLRGRMAIDKRFGCEF